MNRSRAAKWIDAEDVIVLVAYGLIVRGVACFSAGAAYIIAGLIPFVTVVSLRIAARGSRQRGR